ncbi:8-oxo-dGTP diphosphatase [Gracilibacillus ureilyticus]|uniref:8-oxo-dGTP diphosphatase n=1 Tax=Gracilibacillus ureilyticus TaxID=531814 RepID=A0A1H9TR02_9BACI|nr:nucleoside triphosphatase YtkD [Gracilibacillus ureilyticus]SER99451.1 8-oxo-dGTP diphosphatase [Gracilibacillus ureilyticus]
MKTFNDYYNNEVKLSFSDHPFEQYPKHVWVICRYHSKWLLTKHLERGLEFPGGKVEKNETPKEAAIREVNEETGGEVESLYYIGQYFVTGRYDQIAKNIYFAEIATLKKRSTYLETAGPVLLDELPCNIRSNEAFSFIMKDDVLTYSLRYIKSDSYIANPI